MPWIPSEEGERPTLGHLVLDWIADNLIVPDGASAGDPLLFTDEQALFVLRLYELDPAFEGPPIRGRALVNGRIVRRAVLSRPKGWGKALALDTRLPTPTGWTTMGQVEVGDTLLDEMGQPTQVVAATEVMHDRPCYRVTFRDGTSVVADGDHLWPLDEFTNGAVRRRVTVTTQEIYDAGVTYDRPLTTGRTKATKGGVARWRTLPTPTIDGAETELPIPAYLLGYWLGDGDKDCPRVTVHADDLPSFLEQCARLGVETGEPRRTNGNAYRVRFGRGWAQVALRHAGLLHNKHIPPSAMRASYEQRLDLLRGLLDSDGTVDPTGRRIEFCSTDKRLADDFIELARTLGLYPRRTESDAKLNGRTVGTRHRVNLTAYDDAPIFLLPRKAGRLRARPKSFPYSQARTITAVEPVPSVPVRCVTVSGASSLYLAGEGLVPTHNSPLVAALCLAEALAPVVLDGWDADGQPVGREWMSLGFKPKVQIVAVSEDQTTNTWEPCMEMAANGPVYDNYDLEVLNTFINVPRGMIEPVTSSATAREGFRPVFVAADQTEEWTPTNGGVKLAATIRRNLGKVGGCSVETPNAFEPGRNSVAEASFAAVQAQDEGRLKVSTGMLFDHREAPGDTDPGDEASLRAGLRIAYGASLDTNGGWTPEDRIVKEFYDPDTDPQAARRYYLNQITHASDAWVSQPEWGARLDATKVVTDGEQITLGFDGSRRRSHATTDATALIGCRVSDGHIFQVAVWEEPPNTPDWQVPRLEVDAAVRTAFDRYKVVGFYADPKLWETTIAAWEATYGRRLQVKMSRDHPIEWYFTPSKIVRATGEFLSAVLDGEMTHDGASELTRHVLNARRRPSTAGLQIAKEHPESSRKIDAAIAAILAWQARLDAVAKGVKPRTKSRVVVH